jgi:hypothetical protein
MAKKKEKVSSSSVSSASDDLVKVVALKDFPGRKKGETWMAPARKLKKRTREIRLGLIKKV